MQGYETRLDDLVLGTDLAYPFHIYNRALTAPVNIGGYALSFMLKRSLNDADGAALLTKTTSTGITIAGTYNADPDVNAQRATVTIEDADTDALAPGVRYFELKRTDAGFETRLAFGLVRLVRGVHRS